MLGLRHLHRVSVPRPFLGVSRDYSSYILEPRSIDDSSYLSNTEAETPAVGALVMVNESAPSDTRPKIAVNSMTDDVAWHSRTLPNGNFAELQWPARRGLVEVLGISPEAVEIVGRNWGKEKALKSWDILKPCSRPKLATTTTPYDLFEALGFGCLPLGIIL